MQDVFNAGLSASTLLNCGLATSLHRSAKRHCMEADEKRGANVERDLEVRRSADVSASEFCSSARCETIDISVIDFVDWLALDMTGRK